VENSLRRRFLVLMGVGRVFVRTIVSCSVTLGHVLLVRPLLHQVCVLVGRKESQQDVLIGSPFLPVGNDVISFWNVGVIDVCRFAMLVPAILVRY
jgi:hypothetical protein